MGALQAPVCMRNQQLVMEVWPWFPSYPAPQTRNLGWSPPLPLPQPPDLTPHPHKELLSLFALHK